MSGLVLAIDTSIGTSVAVVDEGGRPIAVRDSADPRGHAETIGTFIAETLAAAGAAPADVAAVAVGMGPGAYTGLRVGIAAAKAFAFGRGVPLLGVPSHDAVRAELGLAPSIPVATPAGRRGHYRSQAGELELIHDPLGGDDVLVAQVSAAAVAQVAVARRRSGLPTGPDQAIYLREPDVTPAKVRKRASDGAAETIASGAMVAAAGPAFILRTAEPEDLDAIMAIERANFPEDAWARGTMASELANPHGRYLVATAGGEVVGYAGLRAAGDQADVQTIAVREDRRRLGIGRALMDELLAEAGRRGAEATFLEVRADNVPAQTLYARLGFVAFTIRPGYYPGGVDAVVMQRRTR